MEEVARGSNGIVVRARSAGDDLAAKVSQVDSRGRAARELAALEAIATGGVECAPRAVAVVRPEGIDVLLTEWRDGNPVDEAPPPEADAWEAIVDAYSRVQVATPVEGLRPAVLGVALDQVVEDMRARARLLRDRQGDRFVAAAARVASSVQGHERALVHCEASLSNFLVAGDRTVAIVDWENSGWGDPCYDVANVVMAPQHARHGLDAWDDLIVRHARSLGDERLAERTRAHARVMAAWWVVRLRQELEAPTPRLAGVVRPAAQDAEERLARCEERAATLMRV